MKRSMFTQVGQKDEVHVNARAGSRVLGEDSGVPIVSLFCPAVSGVVH